MSFCYCMLLLRYNIYNTVCYVLFVAQLRQVFCKDSVKRHRKKKPFSIFGHKKAKDSKLLPQPPVMPPAGIKNYVWFCQFYFFKFLCIELTEITGILFMSNLSKIHIIVFISHSYWVFLCLFVCLFVCLLVCPSASYFKLAG